MNELYNCATERLPLPKIYSIKHFGNHWQLFKTKSGKLVRLFGAYEDQRDGQTIVRVLALINGAASQKFKIIAKLWLEGMKVAVLVFILEL